MFPQKSKFFLLFILFVSTNFGFSQSEHESPILGKPRLILEECFGAKLENGIFVKVGKDRQVSWMTDNKMEFDRQGNLTKRSFFDDGREFTHSEEYEFSTNKLQKKKFPSFIYTYKYDNRGNIIEELVAPVTDSIAMKTKHRFAYNGYNLLTNVWEFDFSGGQIFHQTNSYNTAGLLIKENYDYSDGREFKNFTYDTNNHLIKVEWFDSHTGLMERTTFTYNGNKLASEFWEVLEKNKIESTTKYEFDSKGNVTSILDINPKRQIHDHEVNKYIFDDSGNWIKKMTSVNEVRFYIVERFIAYY
ncbi:MAG: RHS repeat domain-containing protein [Bacteroidota bacterium]